MTTSFDRAMREIVLDTETTGLSTGAGHRVTEIGCVELCNHIPTGRIFQQYINPERSTPAEVVQITGLTDEFLSTFPVFASIVDDFLEFIGDAPLVIHNAKFDMDFLNFELARCQRPTIDANRAIDTLFLARTQFPGAPASLDALTKRFNIQIPREKHGALLDAQILAEVYIELTGGRQQHFRFQEQTAQEASSTQPSMVIEQPTFPRRVFPVSDEEMQQFRAMLAKIPDAMWERFLPEAN